MSTRQSPRNDQEKLEVILGVISGFKWTLGKFLSLLFTDFSHTREYAEGKLSSRRTPRHSSFIKKFLSQQPNETESGGSDEVPKDIYSIITAIYKHRDSAPRRRRSQTDVPPIDPTTMARHKLLLWARHTVRKEVESEMKLLSTDPRLRLPTSEQTWATISEFSLHELRDCAKSIAPTLYELLVVAGTPRRRSLKGRARVVKTARKRGAEMIASTAILMLNRSRNSQANRFQKILGVWFCACSAPSDIYRVACRLGLSVGYTTMINTLIQLADSSIESTREIAKLLRFMVVVDNINRKRKFWTPRLGQQDILMSGTASTLVELTDFDPAAFDPKPVADARSRHLRQSITPGKLWERVNQEHLSGVMSLHCLNFLVTRTPALSGLSDFVTREFRTTYAIHRSPEGHVTKAHPLSTSNINEGSAQGCRDAFDEILLHQLQLTPEQLQDRLLLIGGDLGTIEKTRALVSLSSSCPHGYQSYKWVLPLVQLWHMGWADLARILSTHWGKPASRDPSTLWHNCGLLGRNVKPADRPEYYPAQALVFETLEADVLDCWRLILETNDLNLYFESRRGALPDGPALLKLADTIVERWATTRAYDVARHSSEYWDGPFGTEGDGGAVEPSHNDSDSESDVPLALGSQQPNPPRRPVPARASPRNFKGDHVLANSILRLRDSLWHYEFIWSIADGDIGRTMQIMAIWQFTFTGARASKYSTELLELACGFLYEFPPALQEAIMNNWLCNFSGYPGCWFPMDLMQEHHIRELKNKSQRRDKDFESPFFQKVVSRAARYFTQVRHVVNKAVELEDRSASHSHADISCAVTQLRGSLERGQVHSFIPGRSYGWSARDDLGAGHKAMPNKLSRFLHRDSDPDAPTDSNQPEGPTADEELDGEEPDEVPLPVMVIGGQLVTGDVQDDDGDMPELEGSDVESDAAE